MRVAVPEPEENAMKGVAALLEAHRRIVVHVHGAVDDLTAEQLSVRLDDGANSIAWLVWHLTRIQDDHIAGVAGIEQVWTAEGWAARFALTFPDSDTGFGHSPAEVALVRVGAGELLTGYYDAVHRRTADYLECVSDDDLDRVVDTSWDPPVTLGVRLVSLVVDDLIHAGQAAFIRGVLERRAQ